MIKNVAFLEAWEKEGPLRERLTPEQAFALCDAMYEYARSLGGFPPADPLEGLEAKIRLARAINFLPPLDESELRKLIDRA
jgi:hypothetical protein